MDASLKTLILSLYDERITLSEYPQDMKEALKGSARVPTMLFNIQSRIEKLPTHLQKKETIREVVYSFTDIFLAAFKKHADEKMMSEAAKQALLDRDERRKIIEEVVTTGIVTEEAFDVIQKEGSEKTAT